MCDNFVGHDNGRFQEISGNPGMAINIFCRYAEKLYALSSV